jgi:hypothetical protein
VHGLGAAVESAAEISLRIQEEMLGFVTMNIETQTVDLIDDLEHIGSPKEDKPFRKVQTRKNSSIVVTIRRNIPDEE